MQIKVKKKGLIRSIGPYYKAAAGGTPLSLDGLGAEANSSNATTSATIVTSLSNNIIVACLLANGENASTVVGSSLGSFTRRARIIVSGNNVEVWWVLAPSPLSGGGEGITVTFPNPTFNTVTAFAVNGAKTSAPFDTDPSLPAIGSSDPLSVSTAATNTLVFAAYRMAGTANPTFGGGFTQIQGLGNFFAVGCKIFSSPQTGLSIPLATGAGDSNGSIADAIVQGP